MHSHLYSMSVPIERSNWLVDEHRQRNILPLIVLHMCACLWCIIEARAIVTSIQVDAITLLRKLNIVQFMRASPHLSFFCVPGPEESTHVQGPHVFQSHLLRPLRLAALRPHTPGHEMLQWVSPRHSADKYQKISLVHCHLCLKVLRGKQLSCAVHFIHLEGQSQKFPVKTN